MKQFYSILLFSLSFATIITVDDNGPADYSYIQDAIDMSVDGDTVLVHRGFYQENLLIDKSITLTSHAIYDNLSDLESWTQYDDQFLFEWQVTNDNINETIIDGSDPAGDNGSCIIIYNENECITPTIMGFTIQNGTGTEVIRNPGTDNSEEQVLGGGILVAVANPAINYNKIRDNFSSEDCGGRGNCLYSGGGAYMSSDPEDFGFDNRDISRARCDVQEYDLSSNFYNNNNAEYGNTFANRYFEETFDMSQSIFDVANCGAEEVSPVWVYIEEESITNLQGSESDLCAFTAADVYVNPNQNEECTYDGCGTEQNPFKTIDWALQMIIPSLSNPITMHLDEGIYSPSTNNEDFPIKLISNLSLIGQGEELTILNAEETARVIEFSFTQNNTIAQFTITDGETQATSGYLDSPGGGIFIHYSNPIIANIKIINNTAENGGGVHILDSSPSFFNVSVLNNIAIGSVGKGGGIYISLYSNPSFQNVNIIGNEAGYGLSHGIWMSLGTTIKNSIIWDNDIYSLYGCCNDDYLISYSNIEYWPGNDQGGINLDPLFVDPLNDNYDLQVNSPCIDSGDPNLWYNDADGSRSDMGANGGSNIYPSFTEYDFGEVGFLGSNIELEIINLTTSPVIITDINFNSNAFTLNESFPIEIEAFEARGIGVNANNLLLGYSQDEMMIISEDLSDNIYTIFSSTGISEHILSGNLSGTYPAETYRITGDLEISNSDSVVLQPGTKFLFDGNYSFDVFGVLEAIGTYQDSIYFSNYNTDPWKGFRIEGVDEQTVFEFVEISNAEKTEGGGLYMVNSNPSLNNMTICNNNASEDGGGLYMINSNPILSNLDICDNHANIGGGISMYYSDPHLNNILVSQNSVSGHRETGGGLNLVESSPTINNIIISGNEAGSGGGLFLDSYSNPILIDININNNQASNRGGGLYIAGASSPMLTNGLISQNQAGSGGGLSLRESSSPILTNMIISENEASNYAGAIEIRGDQDPFGNPNSCYPIFVNNTIVENIAPESSAIYLVNNAYPTIVNSIIWHNNNQSIGFGSQNDAWSIPQINFSNIEGGWSLEVLPNYLPDGWEGIGNIDIYPFFTDLQNNDYTLQEFSSCIDSGTADIDGDGIDDILDYVGLAPDMGAYEFGGELSNDEDIIPAVYNLKAPYPNPFNPSTTIEFTIPNYSYVSIQVYDIKGRLVSTLIEDYYNPGYHQIQWNGKDYSSGVYFVKMISEDFVDNQKLMLIK